MGLRLSGSKATGGLSEAYLRIVIKALIDEGLIDYLNSLQVDDSDLPHMVEPAPGLVGWRLIRAYGPLGRLAFYLFAILLGRITDYMAARDGGVVFTASSGVIHALANCSRSHPPSRTRPSSNRLTPVRRARAAAAK